MIWAGRVLLVATVLLIVVFRLTRGIWPTEHDGVWPSDPVSISMQVVTWVFAAIWGPLLLPFASLALIENEVDEIRAMTVLGTRRLRRPLRVGFWLRTYGRGWDSQFIVVRGTGLSWLLVTTGERASRVILPTMGEVSEGTGPFRRAPRGASLLMHYLVGFVVFLAYCLIVFGVEFVLLALGIV